jgi:serine protease AprX
VRDHDSGTKAWEWGGRVRRASAAALGLAMAGALLAPSAAFAAQDVRRERTSARRTTVLVRETTDAGNGPEDAVEAAGGHVGRHIKIIDGFVATVPRDAIAGLRARADVVDVTENRRVKLSSYDGFNPVTDPGSTDDVVQETGASAYWAAGYTGAGVDVAVIDSGIAPVEGLAGYRKVVNGPDYSFEAYDYRNRHVDTFGHGTHMSGIIAGRDSDTPSWLKAPDGSHFVGMAPGARIVNMKVADRYGSTDVVQVLLAMDWVVENHDRPGFNIRVMNLSFGTDGVQDYRLDPLTYAAEVAWRSGIAVVVAAGNKGDGTPQLNDPAYDPYVIAVGASDPKGTTTYADDKVASFSSVGNATRHADLVAPGKSIVSLRAPGSTVANENPGALVGTRLLRGSGTSQAAAVVSGAAALIVQQRPAITPDQLKALLVDSAQPLTGASVTAQGAGALDLRDAITRATPKRVQTWTLSTGTGSLELSRGSYPLDDPYLVALANAVAAGDESALSRLLANRWSSNRWSSNRWSSNRWSANRWSSDDWN